MGNLGWTEILVIVVLALILFGHNKIPGMMKNLADGINTFKKEMKAAENKKSANQPEKAGDDEKNKKSSAGVKKSTKNPVKAGVVADKKVVKKSATKKTKK